MGELVKPISVKGWIEHLLIHPDLRDNSELLYRARILAMVAVAIFCEHILLFMALVLSPVIKHAVIGEDPLLINTFSLIATSFTFYLLKKRGNYYLSCLVLIVGTYLAMIYATYITGGPYRSPAAQPMIVPCMMAFFFGGLLWGIFATTLGGITLITMLALQAGGMNYPDLTDPNIKAFIYSAVILATYLVVAALAFAYAFSSRELMKERDAEHRKYLELARIDPLTGLFNRRVFDETLADRVTLYNRLEPKREFAICYVDLDKFKPINDVHGHDVGDEVLAAVSRRLCSALRGADFIGRHGGDEFMIVFDDVQNDATIVDLGKRLLHLLREPIITRVGPVSIGASIGFAMFPMHATTANQLRSLADVAMYTAKQAGKGYHIAASDSAKIHLS